MLGDNSYPTCGVTKAQIREYEVRNKRQVPNGEKPGCVIHELGYAIPFRKGTVIDPLTTMLIMEDERRDPRVDKAIDEMLERYVW
jgi:hypothetical protein